ncbi:MAG: trypsin-like peptidase domain-containing protein [Planctomycetes bacterium]|nr:trypsin-like peptidase domain-containing protein [Planctomycetota bacterium]
MVDNTVSDSVLIDLSNLSGIVVGRNGKGGSGTCVKLEDGGIALLTSKHVVIECIRNTGRIGIAIPLKRVNLQTPRLIRMDSSQQGDAALVEFTNLPKDIPAVPFADWTNNNSRLAVGLPVVACGFPGALRKMERTKMIPQFAWLEDRISSIQGDIVISGIAEEIEDIPTNFRGMSGGGLFTFDGSFIGVLTGEQRNLKPSRGKLYSILPSGYEELYKPFSMPSDAPQDGYYAERRSVVLELLKPDNSAPTTTVGVLAELFWSKIEPNHKFGRIGRIINLEFIIPDTDTHFPINVESLFTWTEDTEEGRLKALEEEFKFLLLRIGWLLKDDQDILKLQVNSMV